MSECLRYRAHKYGAQLIHFSSQGYFYTVYFLGLDYWEHQSLNSSQL